jgi:hypothetical protein
VGTSGGPAADAGITRLAAVTPAELAGDVQAALHRVNACAQAWRNSSSWRGTKSDRRAYECVAITFAEVATVPDPQTYRDVDHLVDVVAPILKAWWSPTTGPQQDLHEAVEELRKVAMHRVVLVRQARRLLGQQW